MASFACDDRIRQDIKEFPLWPSELRDMARFGMLEKKTAEGITYQHMAEAPLRKHWWQFWIKTYKVDVEAELNKLRAYFEKERANKHRNDTMARAVARAES